MKTSTSIMILLLSLLAETTYAQEIEAKLSGATWNQGFTIRDNSNVILFTVRGDGRAVLGTVTPEMKLTLEADGGIIAKGTHGSGATLSTSDAGTRLIWYPRKSAFRAGYAGSQWAEGNIGGYSTAMGSYTTASGEHSTATGFSTTASGGTSTAMGGTTTASGMGSTAMGGATRASGAYTTAMGYSTLAEAYRSTAIGSKNIGGGNPGNWVDTDPLFEIGNSEYGSPRSNAMTVLKNGNVGIGTHTPTQKLEVTGTAKANTLEVTGTATASHHVSQTNLGSTAPPATGGVYADNVVYAWANVPSSGTSTNKFGCTTSKVATGIYSITYKTMNSGDYAPIAITSTAGLISSPHSIVIHAASTTGCQVRIWSWNASTKEFELADRAFFFQLVGRP